MGIEAFAQIRGLKTQQVEDSRDKCFVCSIDRFTFQQHTEGFEHHRQQEHDPWAYMFFIIYLVTKKKVDMTGVESFVYEQVGNLDNEFLPVSRAMSLEQSSHGKNESQAEQVGEMLHEKLG